MELKTITVMPLEDAKKFQEQMAKNNVELVLDHNEQSCTRGCAVTVEVLAYEKDFEMIAKIYQDNYKKLTEGLQVDWEQALSVFDPSASTVTCPACGHVFKPDGPDCPDCGLTFF
ncbi:MAG: zinc ribbon domain-containing protein [Bacteriovoracaceae bacterium]|jgi:rubrerythrin|nr:zinc ribbon domain-containing protein [Bacteriovoracaceae bacterium]